MTEEKIISTLEEYATAYCAKDIDALMHVFDDSDNISVIGTGADELCVGQNEVKDLFLRNFRDATATRFEWDWTDTRISGKHAIVSVTFHLHLDVMNERIVVPLRWTVVLNNKNNHWVWIHRHASAAASNQDEGQAYPIEK